MPKCRYYVPQKYNEWSYEYWNDHGGVWSADQKWSAQVKDAVGRMASFVERSATQGMIVTVRLCTRET